MDIVLVWCSRQGTDGLYFVFMRGIGECWVAISSISSRVFKPPVLSSQLTLKPEDLIKRTLPPLASNTTFFDPCQSFRPDRDEINRRISKGKGPWAVARSPSIEMR